MKVFFLLLSFLLFFSVTPAEAQRPATFACYYTQNISGDKLCDEVKGLGFSDDVDARELLRKVLAPVGLRPNFVLQPCDNIKNCVATIGENGWRYILYDKVFLQNLVANQTDNWASLSIFAHEVLHHLDQHTHVKDANLERRRQMELDADEWSGRIMAMLGATLEQAQSAVNALPESNEDENYSTHPSKQKRMDAVAKGYAAGLQPVRRPVKEIKIENLSMQNHAFINISHPDQLANYKMDSMEPRKIVNIKEDWFAFFSKKDDSHPTRTLVSSTLDSLRKKIIESAGYIISLDYCKDRFICLIADTPVTGGQQIERYADLDLNRFNLKKAVGTVLMDLSWDGKNWIAVEQAAKTARVRDQLILVTDAYPKKDISELWNALFVVTTCKFIKDKWVTILHKYEDDVQVLTQSQGYKTTFPLEEFIQFEAMGYTLWSADFDGAYWAYIMNRPKNFTYGQVKQ
jgi:hypothetical protein